MPVDGELVDAKNAPTVASVIDHALRVADEVEAGELEPKQAMASITALKLAHEALVGERDYRDRKAWAWEKTQAPQGTARENSGSEDGGASSQQSDAPAPVPWMRPRADN